MSMPGGFVSRESGTKMGIYWICTGFTGWHTTPRREKRGHMSKANGRPARLEVGAEVVRTPQTFYEADAKGKAEHRPMRGRVVYIHPRCLFHTVEFQTRGGAVKESFQGVEV